MRYACTITACIFLLNALLAVPCLVECISTDGRCIIETLGHDPCHDVSLAVPAHRDSFLGSDLDPCLDVLLDAPGSVEALARVLLSRPGLMSQATVPSLPCAIICAFPDRLRLVELPVGPLTDPLSAAALRI